MMQYRPMTIADYEETVQLWQNTSGVRLRGTDSQEHIANYLARNPGLSFVATLNHGIVGTLMAGHDGRRGYLQHLAVAAAHRRKGIGTALVDRCVAALAQQGIVKSHISILADNHDGKAFWIALGWQQRTDIETYSFINGGDSNC